MWSFFVSICLPFCEQHYWKSNEPISLKLGVMVAPTSRKNCLTFGGAPVPDVDCGSLFHFPHHCNFRRFISISHTVVGRPIFTKHGEVTDTNKLMNPQHFGRDPPDVQIQINLAVQIRVLDHYWLKFWCWQRPVNLLLLLLLLLLYGPPMCLQDNLRMWWLVSTKLGDLILTMIQFRTCFQDHISTYLDSTFYDIFCHSVMGVYFAVQNSEPFRL